MSPRDIDILEKLLDDLKRQNENAFSTVHDRISKLSENVSKLDLGMAVMIERMDAVTFAKIKTEITQQLRLAQADCPSRSAFKMPSSKKPVPIKDLVYIAGILGAGLAGYLQ